jgi:hypothetical protein
VPDPRIQSAGGNRMTNAVTLGKPYIEILRIAEERAIDLS